MAAAEVEAWAARTYTAKHSSSSLCGRGGGLVQGENMLRDTTMGHGEL
jgi:hypothetical protein